MEHSFELKLANTFVDSFSGATGLGCSLVSIPGNTILCEAGYTCSQCRLCQAMGHNTEACSSTHAYGLSEAERFGGRYIYFCNRGLTFITSPLIGRHGSEARMTVGPFLMVDRNDYLVCELNGNAGYAALLDEIPSIQPETVTQLSMVLFMSVGFMNNLTEMESIIEKEAADAIQGHMTSYILEVKQQDSIPYPYDKERTMLDYMVQGNRPEANRVLNELLGHILLSTGASQEKMKDEIVGLVSVMLRVAAGRGIDPIQLDTNAASYYQTLRRSGDMPALCRQLAKIMNELMSMIFSFDSARQANSIYRSIQYIYSHLSEKLELETLAKESFFSPAYFSRIFHAETNMTVQQFIMEARLKKSAELLKHTPLSIAEIALHTGFADQSYFSRAFKQFYEKSPRQYRKEMLNTAL